MHKVGLHLRVPLDSIHFIGVTLKSNTSVMSGQSPPVCHTLIEPWLKKGNLMHLERLDWSLVVQLADMNLLVRRAGSKTFLWFPEEEKNRKRFCTGHGISYQDSSADFIILKTYENNMKESQIPVDIKSGGRVKGKLLLAASCCCVPDYCRPDS